MSEPFLGEIKMVGFNFAPKGWALCNGQLLPIKDNAALYSLLGTAYGGDGRTTFGVPDMRGCVPLNQGIYQTSYATFNYAMGDSGISETVTLSKSEMAAHTHNAIGTTEDGSAFAPKPNSCLGTATDPGDPIYRQAEQSNLVSMNHEIIGSTGGSQAHNNVQPSLVITFCIALTGLFPTRN